MERKHLTSTMPEVQLIQALEGLGNYMSSVEEITERIYDLQKLISSREISPEAASSIREEYLSRLLEYAEKFFRNLSVIERERARIRLELERLRGNPVASASAADALKEDLSRIDRIYRSINFEVGLIATKYSLVLSSKALSERKITEEEYERQKEVCRRFLDVLAERWSMQKAEFNKKLSELGSDLKKVDEDLKEKWVRYSVGEYEEAFYQSTKEPLERRAKALEERISRIKRYVDGIDSLLFECYLLYSRSKSEPSDLEEMIQLTEVPRLHEVVGITLEAAGVSVEEAYRKLIEYYASTYEVEVNRARVMLESELAKMTGGGRSRDRAIIDLYRSLTRER